MKIIVGLSGGPDSVYLLHKLHAQKEFALVAAHLDHEWRSNSNNDVDFCKQFAKSLNIPFVSKKISELDISFKSNGSKEEQARNYRRHFLESVAQEQSADVIALGQHQDDQTETFFIRLARGTTLSGLQCMKEKDGLYVRPLLHLTKQQILDYCEKEQLKFLTDPTNSSDDFLRNRIRNHLIPALEKVDPRLTQKIPKAIQSLQQAEQALEQYTKILYSEIVSDGWLDCTKLQTYDTYMQKRIISYWIIQNNISCTLSDALLDEILRFAHTLRGGTHTLGNLNIVKKQQNIKII